MIIYIAGAITGHLNYRKRFRKAERLMQKLGHTVINPSILPPGLKNAEDYMHICKAMIDVSDGVYFLQGWRESKGATEENRYAFVQGKRIFEER